MKRPIFLSACIVVILTAPHNLHAQAIPDTTYNQLVRLPPNTWGIQAMDGTFSIPLSDGRTVWLFGDNFIGTATPAGPLEPGWLFVKNGTAIQDSNTFRTLYGHLDLSGSTYAGINAFLQPSNAAMDSTWYWPTGGIEENGQIKVFYQKYEQDATGAPGFQFNWIATDLAIFDLVADSLELDTIINIPVPSVNGVVYGVSILKPGDGFTYVYGHKPEAIPFGNDTLHINRAHVARYMGEAETAAWSYFTGNGGWSGDPADSECLALPSTGTSCAWVPTRISVGQAGDRYLLLAQEVFLGKKVYGYTSPTPTGPWSERRLLFVADHPYSSGNTYGAGVHFQATNSKGLLVSYNVNSGSLGQIAQDPERYRPRFVRLSLGNFMPLAAQSSKFFYGENGDGIQETANKIIRTQDGNLLVAGHWQQSAWLMKLDLTGDTLWSKTFPEGDASMFRDVVELPGGELVAAGWCDSCLVPADAARKIFLQKTTADGQPLGPPVLLGETNKNAQANAIVHLSGGGFALAGTTAINAFNTSAHLYKLDAGLVLEWHQFYSGNTYNEAWDLIQTADGGFAIAGRSFNFSIADVQVFKTNSMGVQLWEENYFQAALSTPVRARALVEVPGGNLAVAGSYYPDAVSKANIFVMEISGTDGSLLDSVTFGTVQDDLSFDLQPTGDGGFLVAGQSRQVSQTDYGWLAWVLRLNNAYQLQEQHFHDGYLFSHVAYSIVPLAADGRDFAAVGDRTFLGLQDAFVWTHRTNGRRLQFDQLPQDFQLYQRKLATNHGLVKTAGWVEQGTPHFTEIKMKVSREGLPVDTVTAPLSYTAGIAEFSLEWPMLAETANYSFEMVGFDGSVEYPEATALKVVAGDAFIIQGQSNAMLGSPNPREGSPFVRSFGSASLNTPVDAFRWQVAGNQANNLPGGLGQWGAVLADSIVAAQSVPVAVLNGATPGQAISFFLPENPNYQHLLARVQKSGMATEPFRAIHWYQGEFNMDGLTSTAQYKTDFLKIKNRWATDFGAPHRYYLVQPRRLVLQGDLGAMAVQEAFRQLSLEIPGAALMSTTDLDHSDCCHFDTASYQRLGRHLYRLADRDLYGNVSLSNVEPPLVDSVAWVSGSSELKLYLRPTLDSFIWNSNGLDKFRLEGSAATMVSGAVSGNEATLQLSVPPVPFLGLSYTDHYGDGIPWIENAAGVGMACFQNFPVTFLVDDSQCFPNHTVAGRSVASGIYRSSGELLSYDSVVEAGAVVEFVSDTGVLLLQNFTVEVGALFGISIQACPGN